MNSHETPRDLPAITPEAAAQLEAMLALHEQMKLLHAQIEYVALMLRLRAAQS
jgi:hypothetical protein